MPLGGGADDLHMSTDVLGQAQRLAADLWDCDFCRFCVNGSTQGNEALALSVARPGDAVVASRNMHKSVFAGLVLAGLEPVWVRPDIDAETGLPLRVPLERVRDALDRGPDVRAVFLVEPSYVGVLSDVGAIAAAAHARGIPLVVDQAWGAHYGFHPDLPPSHAHARRGRDGDVGAQDARVVHAGRVPVRARRTCSTWSGSARRSRRCTRRVRRARCSRASTTRAG